jgi:hypothetical protein
VEERGHFPVAGCSALEVSGMVERSFFVLGEIPNPLCCFGFIPWDDFTNGLANFLPLLVEITADSFGRGVFQIVSGDAKMEMKAFSLSLSLLFQIPPDCVKVSRPREPLGKVSDEQMKFIQPQLFIGLKFISKTQMPVDHPIGDAVK